MNVPDELVAEFDQAFSAYTGDSRAEARRAGLAAVLERHEQMVLERKARDLEKYLTGSSPDWDRAIEQAVRDLRALSEPSEPSENARGETRG